MGDVYGSAPPKAGSDIQQVSKTSISHYFILNPSITEVQRASPSPHHVVNYWSWEDFHWKFEKGGPHRSPLPWIRAENGRSIQQPTLTNQPHHA